MVKMLSGILFLYFSSIFSSNPVGRSLEAKSELEKKLLVLVYWPKNKFLFVHSKSKAYASAFLTLGS